MLEAKTRPMLGRRAGSRKGSKTRRLVQERRDQMISPDFAVAIRPGDPERFPLLRFGQSCRSPQPGTRKLKLQRPRRFISPALGPFSLCADLKNAPAPERAAHRCR